MPLKVIGAGHGRTGTKSLKLALEQLGFGPCYHMVEVGRLGPPHIQLWLDVYEGKQVDYHALFKDFNSTTDYPASIVYDELLKVFPDAKVVLTVRDAEQWYDSVLHTIYEATNNWAARFNALIYKDRALFSKMIWYVWNKYPFKGNFLDREAAIAQFNAHNERVKSTVPADKLLVFNVKEGWAPLCAFLGVPVPDTPFPRVNEQEEFEKFIRLRKIQAGTTIGVSVAVLAIAAYALVRHFK